MTYFRYFSLIVGPRGENYHYNYAISCVPIPITLIVIVVIGAIDNGMDDGMMEEGKTREKYV